LPPPLTTGLQFFGALPAFKTALYNANRDYQAVTTTEFMSGTHIVKHSMLQPFSTLLTIAFFAGATALAQEDPVETAHPCSVVPIFHCAEALDDGSAIGHFGYEMSCPEDLEIVPDFYIPIGDDNYFSPKPRDRGQPINFLPGRHIDEFDAEFSVEEIKKAKDAHWAVMKFSTRIDFSKTRDEDLNCEKMHY